MSNTLVVDLYSKLYVIGSHFEMYAKSKINAMKNENDRFDAWFLVLVSVLMTIAFTIYAALQVWCIVYKGKAFVGSWYWSTRGVSVMASCV
jgi:hypothetical protein